MQLVQKYGISTEMAHHLCTTYGSTAFAVCELSRPTGATAGVHRFGKELVKGFPFMEEEVRTQYLPTVCLLCTLYSPSWRRRSVQLCAYSVCVPWQVEYAVKHEMA